MGVCGRKPRSERKNQKPAIPLKHEQGMSETQKFLDYIKEAKSKNTYKSYRVSLRLFEEYYGKSCDEALEERREDVSSGNFERNRRFAREIEKFHSWMIKEGYTINSARANTIGVRQLFKFYGMPVVLEPQTGVTQTVITTKDFVPKIEQYSLTACQM